MTTDRSLRRLLDDATADDAARRRAGRGANRARRGVDATFAGVLAELRDAGAEVRVSTTDREFVGVISEVHTGGIIMHSGSIRRLVRLGSIQSVRRTPGSDTDSTRLDGERTPDSPLGWGSLLGDRHESDDEVMVSTSTRTIEGRVVVISRSVLQLRASDGGVDYVAVDEVEAISLSVPGSMRHDSTNVNTSSRITRITRPNR